MSASSAKVPPFHGQISFNAHHAPMGAFFSFTCGHFGTRGGLGLQLGKPANQDLYIGVKHGDRYADTPLRCLPFYEGAVATEIEEWDAAKGQMVKKKKGVGGPALPDVAQQAAAAAANFLVEQAADPDLADPDAEKKKPKVTCYAARQIARHYGWGTDRWQTPDFSFEVCTPFGAIPDPATATAQQMRDALLPGVVAELRVDNRRGKTVKTGFFALGFHEAGVHVLDEGLGASLSKRLGFALRNHLGVAGQLLDSTTGDYVTPANEAFVFMRWSPNEGLADRDNPVHLLGSCPGIGFEVPPGKCYSLVLALGGYLDGVATTRIEGRYLYTRYFANLRDVLGETLTRGYELWQQADAADRCLLGSGLSADQQFLVAHATRSYYGSTELLDVGGQPWWIVNEGEYVMINTLDLSVDQVFWELGCNPWVVRNLLDRFVQFYSYHDQVKDPRSGKLHPGGLSFCHDQGIHNQFSPLGHSSYELTNLPGCFSHMTAEQLCNWSLVAACYVARTDDQAWLAHNAPVIRACLASLQQRDNPDPKKRNGVMGFDSSRCGTGQEITTYDSLDHSLAQARNNAYMAVKGWATYLGLGLMLERLGEAKLAAEAYAGARLAAATVSKQLRKEGFLPAVFEKNNPGYESRILPAVEGLVYPAYWASCGVQAAATWVSASGPFKGLLKTLATHTRTLLGQAGHGEGANRFADGGLKLSSTSNNSWVSKIALTQHVCRRVLGVGEDGRPLSKAARVRGGFVRADAAHVKWETEGASAYWAMSDQMVKGVAIGSKYYPRCVTNVLWFE